MAGRAEVETKTLAERLGELLGGQGLVALEDLGDRFHRIIFKVIFLDFGGVETGISLNLDHVSAISGVVKSLPQRSHVKWTISVSSLRFDEPVPRLSGQVTRSDFNRGAWVRPSPVLLIPGIQKRAGSCQGEYHADSAQGREREPPRYLDRLVHELDPMIARRNGHGQERVPVSLDRGRSPSTSAVQPGSQVSRMSTRSAAAA